MAYTPSSAADFRAWLQRKYGGTDLITGRQVVGPITLSPLAVAVLAYPK